MSWRDRAIAVDPGQPGVQAIGDTGLSSPSPAPVPAPQPAQVASDGGWKSRATAVTPAKTQPQDKDWVDYLSEAPGHVADALTNAKGAPGASLIPPLVRGAGAAAGYIGGPFQVLAAKLAGMIKSGENPVSLLEDLPKAALGKAPGIGDYAVDKFGVPDASVDIPGTNNKKLTARDLINFIGNAAVNPLTYGGAKMVGKSLYESAINPVEVEGARLGKAAIGDILNKNRVMTEGSLPAKGQAIVNKNMDTVVRPMEQGATDAGATADIKAAMGPAQAHVDDIMKYAKPGSAEEKMAQEMQKEIDLHTQMAAKPSEKVFTPKAPEAGYDAPTIAKVDRVGTPEPANQVNGKPTRGLGPTGPVINDTADQVVHLPQQGDWTETPATPGPSPNATARWKTDAYNNAKSSAYDPAKRSDSWQTFYKAQGYGLKDATEKAIEKVYGSEGLAKYQQANAESGAILSTGKVQGKVAAQQARDLGVATSIAPSMSEGLMSAAAGGAAKDVESGLSSFAVMRALRAAKLARMPVGYMLRNTPQAPITGAVLQSNNPWANPQGEQ
jgi:hypothetical protein